MAAVFVWFWNERFWLPHNVTWADLKSSDEASFPQAEHLYVALPLASCIFMFRWLFQRFVARPCGTALKIQANRPQKAQSNAILEKVFTAITKFFLTKSDKIRQNRLVEHNPPGDARFSGGEMSHLNQHPDEKRLEGLSKQLDWDVRTIQRWFRQRRNQEKPSILCCFCDSMWRFVFYLYIFTYGVRFLKKTTWLWNTRNCWCNYPYQPLTVDLQYYYIVQLSSYLYLLFSQLTDIRRKDFLIMFTHHVVTILLLIFSYVNNMVRVGALVMCLHDAADVLMEAAKMASYAKCQRLCNIIFLMFALVFMSLRLGVYPIWILKSTLFESWEIIGPYPSWWVFNSLLLLLLALHVFWSCLIVKTACRAISKGRVPTSKAGKWNPLQVSKDNLSDVESGSDEEKVPPPSHRLCESTTNGNSGTKGHFRGPLYPDEH